MNIHWKQRLRDLVAASGIFLLIGGLTFILYLFGNLGMFPLYVTRVIPCVGIAGALTAVIAVCSPAASLVRRFFGYAFLCVCLVSAGYAGWGFYHDSVPTVDEAENRTAILFYRNGAERSNPAAGAEQNRTHPRDHSGRQLSHRI